MRFFPCTPADLRTHPISSTQAAPSGEIDAPSTISGRTPGPRSSLVVYMVIALSYSVSCSRAYLCLPESRCFSSDEYCRKDLTHPSSGQKNRSLPSSLQLSSSSLLFLFCGASSKTGFYFGLLLALAVWKDTSELELCFCLFS